MKRILARVLVGCLAALAVVYVGDWAGTATVDCSRSLFPQAGSGACWWLRRNKVIYER